jgi:hypothetical protein
VPGHLQKHFKKYCSIRKMQMNLIALGESNVVGALDNNMPKSAVLGLKPATGPTDFGNKQVVAISPSVKDLICHQHMKIHWKTMVEGGKKFGWCIFEAFTRFLMPSEHELECHCFVWKQDPQYKKTSEVTVRGLQHN